MTSRRCKECGGKGDHRCHRCGNWRCWGHLDARKVPGVAGAFRLICRGRCRLRERNRCTSLSPTGHRCKLPSLHEGPHQLTGWWLWEEGATDYLPKP